jgi:hypothetical protein
MLPAFTDISDKVFAVTDVAGIDPVANSLDVIDPICNLDPGIELLAISLAVITPV